MLSKTRFSCETGNAVILSPLVIFHNYTLVRNEGICASIQRAQTSRNALNLMTIIR
jgi:hypothetical protein